MKRSLFITALFALVFSSCTKDKEDDNNLPQNLDFTNLSISAGAKTFTTKGVTFSVTGYSTSSYTPFTGWTDCPTSNNAEIRFYNPPNGGINLSSHDSDRLIGDLSNLPPVNKITIRVFNNGGPTTELSACDANGLVMKTNVGTGPATDQTMTLNIGGKKLSKVVVSSLEAVLFSINIE